jgi:hypothetical protein
MGDTYSLGSLRKSPVMRLALSQGPNRLGVSPHLRMETDPFSETSCFSSNYLEFWRRTKSETPIILCVIHHCQNPVKNHVVAPRSFGELSQRLLRKKKAGKPVSTLQVAGTSGCKLTCSQQSGNIYIHIADRTSQETRYVSATKTDRLMLFWETSLFIERTIRNTQIHCVGKMQTLSMLKQVVHIVTTGLYGIALEKTAFFINYLTCPHFKLTFQQTTFFSFGAKTK